VPDEAVVPMLPDAVRSYVQDVLADDTKPSEVVSWRVYRVVLGRSTRLRRFSTQSR
jgi:hypothetical protein